MGAEATLKMILLGEDRSAGRALKGVGGDADRTRSKFSQLARVSATALAGGLVVAGGAALKLAQGAAEDEKAATRLATTLKNTTKATDDQVASVEDWITAQGKATGITDDELRPALGRLVTATKDVGKAQELTLLAQNVAVGTGKSLESVAFALAKAQNGNVTGLARLGIATKDADGKTKSLKQITEDLARTYKGQAAEAAETAAGKQKIMTTQLSEAGEAIGYKLIPVLAEGAEAVTEFIDEFERGTGVGGEVRDILEGVADAGEAVFHAIDSLPGPVKKYGAEMALAVLVMSKMRTMTGPLSAGLTTIATNFRNAETRSAGFRTSMRGLGSTLTNVAGAGGMLLLADGADEAGSSMGTLKMAAGGALSGAALGAFAGPPGAAIGAALGGLTGAAISLAKGTNDAGKSAKVNIPSWREYQQTLAGVSASTTKATREMVLQRLESSGLLKATRELGLSDREAVNAMMGNHAARKKLSVAIRDNTSLTREQKDALIRETGAVGAARLKQLQHNVAIAGSATELRKAKQKLREFMNTPAAKRVSVLGTELAKAKIDSLRASLQTLWSTTAKGQTTSGPGGIEVLLNPSKHAVGTRDFAGGLTWINESGPELVNLPRGSQIYSATQSSRMVADGGDSEGVITIVVQSAETGETIETKLVKVKRTSGRKKLAFESS